MLSKAVPTNEAALARVHLIWVQFNEGFLVVHVTKFRELEEICNTPITEVFRPTQPPSPLQEEALRPLP